MKHVPAFTVLKPEKTVQPLPLDIPEGSHPEIPIWVVQANGKDLCYVTTGHTIRYTLSTGKHLLSDTGALDPSTGKCVSIRTIQAQGYPEQDQIDREAYWRQMYYGVFSAHLVSDSETSAASTLMVLHGENKNEYLPPCAEHPGRYYDNSILPVQNYTDEQYSGYFGANGGYRDNWATYFGFVCMAWSSLSKDSQTDEEIVHDLGPIAWPSTGYVNSQGTQASRGLRHPSSIVHDGYLYVFYVEECPEGYGDGLGIKVARAALDDLPAPDAFRTYYDGAFRDRALPEGFVKQDRRFLAKPGGRSSNILDCFGVSRFSTAKIANTPYFMGVESYQHPDSPDCEVRLRLSEDLVNWGPAVAVPGTRQPAGTGLSWYPILADVSYSSHAKIEASAFLIAGSGAGIASYREIGIAIED